MKHHLRASSLFWVSVRDSFPLIIQNIYRNKIIKNEKRNVRKSWQKLSVTMWIKHYFNQVQPQPITSNSNDSFCSCLGKCAILKLGVQYILLCAVKAWNVSELDFIKITVKQILLNWTTIQIQIPPYCTITISSKHSTVLLVLVKLSTVRLST